MKTATLTPAEMEIAERIALGESKKEVADHTFRSVYTVETTVYTLLNLIFVAGRKFLLLPGFLFYPKEYVS